MHKQYLSWVLQSTRSPHTSTSQQSVPLSLLLASQSLMQSLHANYWNKTQVFVMCTWPTYSPLVSQLSLPLQTSLNHAPLATVNFHLHTHRTFNQPHPLLKLPSSPSVPSLRRKNPNSSHLQHPTTCPLDPIPSHLLQAISPKHYQHISPHRHSSPLRSSSLG